MTSQQSITPLVQYGPDTRSAAPTSEVDAARTVLDAASSQLIAFLAGSDAQPSGVTLSQLRSQRVAARLALDVAQQRRSAAAGLTVTAADRSSLGTARAA